MQRILSGALLVTLIALTACSGPMPVPETAAPTPATAPTEAPAATEPPPPTESASPTPTNSLSPEPTPIPPSTVEPPREAISALTLDDSEAAMSELSDAEKACLQDLDDTGNPIRAFSNPSMTTQAGQANFIGCLQDDTLARIFLAVIVPVSEPFSLETSACIRAAFEVIDPRAVMTAGIEGDPGVVMGTYMTTLSVTIACMNHEEWEAAAPKMGIRSDEREEMRCLMEKLGGPGEMTEAMRAAQEGNYADLDRAGTDCGLDMGLVPVQVPATPPPWPTPTVQTPSQPALTPPPAPATTLVITVVPIPEGIPEYGRKDWKHWTDADGDCQDARHEVLLEESLMEVTFKTDRECEVAAGRWYGAFTGVYVEDPGSLDIDHLVPLKNAYLSGGWTWSSEEKEQYANHLENPDHLIAVTAGANRSKGARGPEDWRPPDESYWCEYATGWTEIKARWGLTMSEAEAVSVMEMLEKCETAPAVEVIPAPPQVTTPPPTGGKDTAYRSCDEASAAGERRVQGDQGPGRGFPKALVPSARDGDGDGIVCET